MSSVINLSVILINNINTSLLINHLAFVFCTHVKYNFIYNLDYIFTKENEGTNGNS